MPGRMGELLPRSPTITVEAMDVTQRPDFPVRNFWEHGRGDMAAEEREWKIHNFMNPDSADAVGVPGDGSVVDLLPEDLFKQHPDWFARQQHGGYNRRHPCTTSEPMIQHMIEKVKANARAGKAVTSFAPEDGTPRCWCDRCAKMGNGFDGYGANNRDPVPESCVSNEWFYFVNRILDGVNREYPGHLIATNGYANRDVPPELPPDVEFNRNHNLTVMFANICACTIHAYDDPRCWQMQRQGQMIRGWGRLSDKVWIYNYNYTMLISKGTITPMVHRLRRNIPLLKEWGIIGFHDQDECDLALSGLPTRLVRARLEWNTRADVDAILDDFFTRWFGPAARPMKAYYDALEEAFDRAGVHGHEDVILPSIYTDSLMARLDGLIREAAGLATAEELKPRMAMEMAIYDLLKAYVAMIKAEHRGAFAEAAGHAGRIASLMADMNRITPFMGYHPYPTCEADWEQKRMQAAAALTDGPGGRLIAMLPEAAAFRTDPHDDGRFERWQDLPADAPGWTTLRTTAGWDAQGFQYEHGHPYQGAAWYRFDIDLPAGAATDRASLHAMAVVNEAWVWVNGKYAGHRPYKMQWSRPQDMDLDVSKLLVPGRNRIAVRVLCNAEVWGANGIYERLFLYTRSAQSPPDKPSR
jgi:hypothetical protein